jgi:hypothetical protein
MGQTIEELFFEFLPTDLYRSGTASSPNLHKPRTMPPRNADQVHDVKVSYVDADSGGLSTFTRPNLRFGNRWWKLPKGTKIPEGLRVSRDTGMNQATGAVHYTIRPLHDMPLWRFIQLLERLAASAVPEFEAPSRKAK